MADYYPLIARAIAGLDPSAPGESRRALYERARAALIAQLRSVEPPLSESEITRERLSLEEAVRKVESEAAQRAREASRSSDARGDRGNLRLAISGTVDCHMAEAFGERDEIAFGIDHDLLDQASALFEQAAQQMRLAGAGIALHQQACS